MARPHLLTHWTGKDIDEKYGSVETMGSLGRSAYVERLKSTLRGGFWMMTPPERLRGRGGVYIEYTRPMTCFTELRTSKAHAHSAIYGHLGIAVDRSFVLSRQGGPVRYVWSRNDDLAVGRLYASRYSLERLERAARRRKAKTDVARIQKLRAAVDWSICFTKDMGALNGSYAQLDEEEWRIVADDDIPEITATGGRRPFFKIPLTPLDVKMLIVPDSDTRHVVSTDREIRDWFSDVLPPILTGQDATQL